MLIEQADVEVVTSLCPIWNVGAFPSSQYVFEITVGVLGLGYCITHPVLVKVKASPLPPAKAHSDVASSEVALM